MNRRDFFKKLALAGAGFAILPAATTYERQWVPVRAVAAGMYPKIWRCEFSYWINDGEPIYDKLILESPEIHFTSAADLKPPQWKLVSHERYEPLLGTMVPVINAGVIPGPEKRFGSVKLVSALEVDEPWLIQPKL